MVDAVPSDVDAAEAVQGTRSDPHLRSAAEVVG
jgi:hypothetical protein